MTILTMQNCVACSPVTVKQKIQDKSFSSLLQDGQPKLLESNVIFVSADNFRIGVGDKVFLNPEAVAHTWFNKKLTVNGQDVIMVPLDQIWFVETKE